MRENIVFRPTGEVEQRPGGEEVEAGLGQLHPVFADKPLVELLLQPMKIADIAGSIFALGIVDFRRSPVAGLLLLRQVVPASP